MAKISARNSTIFADGYLISSRLNTATLTMNADAPDVTCFGEDNRERLSNGIRDNEFSMNGFYDTSASQIDDIFSQFLTGSNYYGFYFVAASPGYAGRDFGGVLSEYNLDESVEGAAALSATVSGSSPVYIALSLGYSTCSLDGSFVTGEPVNFSGSTDATKLILRVLAIDRSNTDEEFSACVQDASASGGTWSTIYEFSAASYVQLQEVDAGSANTWRRVVFSGSGTTPFDVTFMASSGSIAQ